VGETAKKEIEIYLSLLCGRTHGIASLAYGFVLLDLVDLFFIFSSLHDDGFIFMERFLIISDPIQTERVCIYNIRDHVAITFLSLYQAFTIRKILSIFFAAEVYRE
jgi:hypothetical protein